MGVALVDLTFAMGEGALRVASLVFGALFGDKAFSAAVEGIARFLFFGNLWWPMLHVAAAVLLGMRGPTWRWGVGLAFIVARLAFVLVNGRPWFDIASARWPASLGVFYSVVFVVLAAAHLLAKPPPTFDVPE